MYVRFFNIVSQFRGYAKQFIVEIYNCDVGSSSISHYGILRVRLIQPVHVKNILIIFRSVRFVNIALGYTNYVRFNPHYYETDIYPTMILAEYSPVIQCTTSLG